MLTSRKQIVFLVLKHVGFAVLAIAVAGILVTLFSHSIVKISTLMSEGNKAAALLTHKTQNLPLLQRVLETVGKNDEKIRMAYPPGDNILDFVGGLESAAKQNSLNPSLSFSQPVLATENNEISLKKTDFSINLDGNSIALKNYLKAIEVLPYMFQIHSINLIANSDRGWEGNSTVTISGTLYVQNAD